MDILSLLLCARDWHLLQPPWAIERNPFQSCLFARWHPAYHHEFSTFQDCDGGHGCAKAWLKQRTRATRSPRLLARIQVHRDEVSLLHGTGQTNGGSSCSRCASVSKQRLGKMLHRWTKKYRVSTVVSLSVSHQPLQMDFMCILVSACCLWDVSVIDLWDTAHFSHFKACFWLKFIVQ